MWIYAGIGSRKTPKDILNSMILIGKQLSRAGWLLRSGHADGADKAFESGAICSMLTARMEIYLPWNGFNGADMLNPSNIVPFTSDIMWHRAEAIAAKYHPAWDKPSAGAKKMHIRNVAQVLGQDCNTPANMVVCWTADGKASGGTGQAIRIADAYGVPVFNLYHDSHKEALAKFVNSCV